MADEETIGESQESILCKSCGLCCSGHLFSWVRLNASELDHSEALGLKVIRSDPHQRGFTQPCPVWDGVCTVHASPRYPRGCRKYQCKLLKKMIGGDLQLPESLRVVQQAMVMIRDIEPLLPASPRVSFRERLVAQLEQGSSDPAFQMKADALLAFFELQFGVNDFLDTSIEGTVER